MVDKKRWMSDQEFGWLLDEVHTKQSMPFQICFKMMAYLALRISDATTLKVHNFNKDCSVLTYVDKKTKVDQIKHLPEFLREEVSNYIRTHEPLFANGFIFPSRMKRSTHLKATTFRMFFRDFRRKYNLDTPLYYTKNNMPLYRISPHTLKHYCLYKVYEASGNDINFVKTFSGHKEMKHTLHYIQSLENRKKQASVIGKAFDNLRFKSSLPQNA